MRRAIPNPEAETPLATQAMERPLRGRSAAYAEEVRRLLDAGMAVMQRAGTTTSPRVADIVREAGLSNYVFYRHFASKHDLVAAIVERGMHQVVTYLGHQMDKDDDPHAQIRRWIEGIMRQASNIEAANTARAVLWNDDQLSGPAKLQTQGSRELLGSLLHEPLAHAGSQDPQRDATVITHAAMARMEDFLFRGTEPSRADIDHLTRFCLAAIDRTN